MSGATNIFFTVPDYYAFFASIYDSSLFKNFDKNVAIIAIPVIILIDAI